MPNIENRRLVKSKDVLLQDLEGEAVLLNLANGLYYGMDENSYQMYKILLSCETAQAAYEALLREYAVEPGQLKADLDQFIEQLLENGLLMDANHAAE